MVAQRVRLIEGGKLVIPVQMRRILGVGTGDTVLVELDDGELRVRTLAGSLERARAIVRANRDDTAASPVAPDKVPHA